MTTIDAKISRISFIPDLRGDNSTVIPMGLCIAYADEVGEHLILAIRDKYTPKEFDHLNILSKEVLSHPMFYFPYQIADAAANSAEETLNGIYQFHTGLSSLQMHLPEDLRAARESLTTLQEKASPVTVQISTPIDARTLIIDAAEHDGEVLPQNLPADFVPAFKRASCFFSPSPA